MYKFKNIDNFVWKRENAIVFTKLSFINDIENKN
jgi:hypothetical protein